MKNVWRLQAASDFQGELTVQEEEMSSAPWCWRVDAITEIKLGIERVQACTC